MKKSEYYKFQIDSAKKDLAELVGKVIDKYVPEDRSISFHELAIGTPIFRESADEDLNEVISGVWTRFDGKENKVVFTIDDAMGSGYDVNMDDLDTDMVIYLLGEFENVTL